MLSWLWVFSLLARSAWNLLDFLWLSDFGIGVLNIFNFGLTLAMPFYESAHNYRAEAIKL